MLCAVVYSKLYIKSTTYSIYGGNKVNPPNRKNIIISESTYNDLVRLKIHPRQSFDEIIKERIKYEDNNIYCNDTNCKHRISKRRD